jgi:DNA polymerase bacteriophage-type
MSTVVLDFETRSRCELTSSGSWRYAEDETTEIICLCWKYEDDRVMTWLPEHDFSTTHLYQLAKRPDVMFVAHNAGFEKAIWRHIMEKRYGAPPVPNSRWHDTMAMCAMRAIPQGLAKVTGPLKLPADKDAAGNKLIKRLCKPDPKTGEFVPLPPYMDRVISYCADDVIAQDALHRRLGWLPEGERDVWLLDQRINERGYRLDMPLVKCMQNVVDGATGPLAQEFQELTGVTFSQTAEIRKWCYGQGYDLPNLQAETIAVALGHSPDYNPDDLLVLGQSYMPPKVRRSLEIRQLIGSASVKKLRAAEAVVMEDGVARGGLAYHAASPGRWGGRLLQPHNFPRGSIDLPVDVKVEALMSGDYEYVEALLGPAIESCVSSLRHIIVPRRGRMFCAGDFSTIEVRLTLSLAGQDDKVALIAAGGDPYCDMAGEIYGRTITKADMVERQTGKNSVLGLGFGMGPPKFQLKYDARQGLDLDFYQGVVKTYRQDWAPMVPEMWYGLQDAATRAVWGEGPQEAYGIRYQREDRWLTARLPSGRKLWYFNPIAMMEKMPWSTEDNVDVRRSWSFYAEKTKKWVEVKAFGGLLTQNLAEGMARDLLTTAMFKCEKEGIPVVLTVHDEIVGEPLEAKSDAEVVLKQIMEDRPHWACYEIGVPVKSECWTGDRYRK